MLAYMFAVVTTYNKYYTVPSVIYSLKMPMFVAYLCSWRDLMLRNKIVCRIDKSTHSAHSALQPPHFIKTQFTLLTLTTHVSSPIRIHRCNVHFLEHFLRTIKSFHVHYSRHLLRLIPFCRNNYFAYNS